MELGQSYAFLCIDTLERYSFSRLLIRNLRCRCWLLLVMLPIVSITISTKWHMETNAPIYSCVIMLRESDGRMGNRMFMYAAAYGLAKKYNCHMHVDGLVLENLGSNFRINPTRLIPKNMHISIEKSRQLYNGCQFQSSPIINQGSGEIIELTGYWQSYKYFHHCWRDILHQFTFHEKIIFQLKNQLSKDNNTVFRTIKNTIELVYSKNYMKNIDSFDRQQILKRMIVNRNKETLIGMHVRRGDFLEKEHLGFVVSSVEYIMRGMSFFCQKYSKCLFLVASDNKTWCKQKLKDIPNVIFTPDNLMASEDMALLALCQHTLITTGTFGWWVAMLTQGTIVCDASYPQNQSWLSNLCPVEHYIPPWFNKL